MHKNRVKKATVLLTMSLSLLLSGCSSLTTEMQEAMDNNQDIELSIAENSNDITRNYYEWTELDQLKTFDSIRDTWDDVLQITKFDINSKNGCIFIDTNSNWAGNNTLYNAFQNKVFVETYWQDGKIRSALAEPAIEEFSDIENEATGLVASVNAYFNLVPVNEDKTSGLFNYLTRAEAMAAIYKGDTPVILNEEQADFKEAVGENNYNTLAQEVNQFSYLQYEDGALNKYTYNSTMTRAEAVYILVQKYFKEEYDSMDKPDGSFTDCKNAGDIATKNEFTGKHSYRTYELEYVLQNSKKGAPESLYKALCIAQRHNIISNETRWNLGINGGELINMLINTYSAISNEQGYAVDAKNGLNPGAMVAEIDNDKKEKKPKKKEEQTIGEVAVHKLSDLADIDDLIKTYGNEISMTEEEINEAKQSAEGFTIEEYDAYMKVDFCDYLNVRVGPSTDYRIIKSVPKETKVHIVGRCQENGWYRVIADGKITYQCGVYFSEL